MPERKVPHIIKRLVRRLNEPGTVTAQPSSVRSNGEIEALRATVDRLRGQCDVARLQRDEARRQRDVARQQRDVARVQRDAAQEKLEGASRPTFRYWEMERYVETGGREGALPTEVDPSSVFGRALLKGRYHRPWFVVHEAYSPPPAGVAFATVCNDKYLPGLEALILSVLRVYPKLECRFVVFHDDTLSRFSRNRLAGLYPHVDFRKGSTKDYRPTLGDAYNHRRVGLLGYLSLKALEIEEADRVVLFDSDLLVLGDISPLWQGEAVNAVIDIGIRPFGVTSPATNRPVINSGVLSLPRSELGPDAVERACRTMASLDECTCEILNLYADQKFWNLHLANSPVNYLPHTFNANKALVELYFPDQLHNVSVLHITGAKPWYSFANEHLLSKEDSVGHRRARSKYTRTFTMWESLYCRELSQRRLEAFQSVMGPHLEKLEFSEKQRPCVLIGNGQSLAETDLTVFDGFVKVAFNWFVHHDGFDDVAVDHLVLSSHMFFGGWHTTHPAFPEGFLEALRRHKHRPVLWVSFYFREYIEHSGVLDSYEVRYLLYEKPFKASADALGRARLDLRSFLLDAHTGVLSAGAPLAVHLGCNAVVLVGCDSNYSQTTGSDYFYAATRHTSPTTNPTSLTSTWLPGGAGPYCYHLTHQALAGLGILMFDATIGGALDTVPKIPLSQVRSLLDPLAGQPVRDFRK